jgi:hypothetical protein
MRNVMRALLAVAAVGWVAGCTPDPFGRPHTWSLPPTGLGANDSNLRTMLVNPNDLAAGTGDDTSVGALSAHPVDALLKGHRKSLPSVSASQIGASGLQVQPTGGDSQGGTGTTP